MTHRPSLEEIVERCVEDVHAGRATPAECLERWPEHRADLEPILQALTAVRVARSVGARAPDPARRGALVAALRELPQERPRRRLLPRLPLPSLPSMPLGGLAVRFAAAAIPAAAVALVAFLFVISQAGSPATAATLTLFTGEVDLYRDGRWQPALDGAAVGEGARVRTSDAGWALVTFEDGTSVTLDPGTDVTVERAVFDGPRELVLHQRSGRLWSDVAPAGPGGGRYAVQTPDATFEALGTVFETAVDGDVTTVTTASGLVRVIEVNGAIHIARGEMARIQDGRLAEHRAASVMDAAVVVRAPFAATLFSELGAATGARPNGLILHQVRGVTTTLVGIGAQRFDLQDLAPGAYTLFLERLTEGDGELIVRTLAGDRVIQLGSGAVNLQLRLEVTDDFGLARLRLLDDEIIEGAGPPPVRVPDHAAARAADRVGASPAGNGSPAATAVPRATPPAFVVRAQEERETFRERIDDALQAGDRDRLRDLIELALDDEDPGLMRARMSILTQVLGNQQIADLMRDVLTEREPEPAATPVPATPTPGSADPTVTPTPPRADPGQGPPDTPPGLANRLEQALRTAGPPAATEHLDRVLRGREAPGRGPR